MFYERMVRYPDYRIDGKRSQGVGFLKVEVMDRHCCIELGIRNLPERYTFVAPITFVGNGESYLMGEIDMAGGRGFWHFESERDSLGGTRLDYRSWEGLRIRLSENREIYCVVREGQAAGEILEPAVAKDISQFESKQVSENVSEEVPEEVTENVTENVSGKVTENVSGKVTEEVMVQSLDQNRALEPDFSVPMEQKKWQQIVERLPHVFPFGDEREYLSIQLTDFVIFSEESYPLSHNSFLLHGLHNYRHLLLCKKDRQEGGEYYIGVPGVYYEKERQAAKYFGFVAFEGAKEKAVAGEFGYYMIPVSI